MSPIRERIGPPPTELWSEACAVMRARLGEKNFTTWIAPLRWTWTEGAVALEAPDQATCDRVGRHFLAVIEEAVAAAAGRACRVHLGVSRPRPLPMESPPPEHTFETFLVGESNGEAYRAAQGLLRETSPAPLFLYGPTGVGKTHLLHAVCHGLTARGAEVACLPAADFLEALLTAYPVDRGQTFWQTLEPFGALLLDDIHSLAGREATQECLGDGLIAWVDGKRPLLLTSDRPPDDIPALAAQWRDRFGDGRIARIDPPEPALRTAILHFKARALGLEIDLGLAARIASAVGGSVRRLEGALTRLLARVRLSGRRLDDALASEALPELRARPPAPPTVERIVEETAAAFAVPARALWGRSRKAEIRLPRQVAMFLARRLLRQGSAELAEDFGRDRATVSHSARAIAARIQADPELAARIGRIEQRLVGSGR